ncbi:MAG: HDIG domain-containing protein [Prevotella sp.]|nr:HDIG domain-containing protein [Prevotella sp.]
MIDILKKRRYTWQSIASRSLIVVITTAIIVWFLPRNEGQSLHYDIGKPWMYNSFIAKFDFPIYKTDQAVERERDSLLALYQPYYNFDTSIEQRAIDKFNDNFADDSLGITKSAKQLVINRLHELYQTGIISTPEYNSLSEDTTALIRVVTGKEAKSNLLRNFNSTLSAYEQVFADKSLASLRPILQKCNLNEYIEPNLIYDKERNETEQNDLRSSVPLASGMVISGQKVIDRGDIVDEYTYRVLNSFEREMKRRTRATQEITSTLIGQTLFVLIMIALFTIYLSLYRKDYFDKPRSIIMLYGLVVFFSVLVSLMMSHNLFSVYILPIAVVPIFIRVFLDSRTAFIAHVVTVLICAISVRYQYEFIIIQIVAGLVAIYSLRDLASRAQLFKSAMLITLASAAIYFAMQLIQTDSFDKMDADMYKHFIVGGIFLLLAYPAMYIVERAFGFSSNVTLVELSNTNKGALRDLSEIAPGTFQHSITVGNLAAEIANKIGANSMLVRTGALYHDIGKMTNPVFFTENQAGTNPHDNMPYTESAHIIISHVADGLKIADKYSLPQFIKDFISTHHGCGMAKYFYIKQKNEHPNDEIDESQFQYPGPNPFTREQAILMMADSVEAASRSLSEYTEEAIATLVDNIIDRQVADGFFTNCPITFSDIRQAKAVIIERLKSIYHTRISYPELKK